MLSALDQELMIHQRMMPTMKNQSVTLIAQDPDQVPIIIMILIMIRGQWVRIINITVALLGRVEVQVRVAPEMRVNDRL